MLRVALAGAGMVSVHHLRAWAALADAAQVVAIADPHAESARLRCADFGIPAAFADAGRMLDAMRPDVLDIAAGHAAHLPLCVAAAERGIAVLCQKPLAPTLTEAREIVQRVASRVRLMIHENWRFRPWYRQARRWLDEGEIGVPRSVTLATRSSAMLARDGKRPALERQPMLARVPRLMIGEVLVHHLDVVGDFMGPLLVTGASARHGSDAVMGETYAEIALSRHDVMANVCGDFIDPSAPVAMTDSMLLAGTDGSIELAGNGLLLAGRNRREAKFDLEAGYQHAFDSAIAHFVDALRQDRPFATSPEVHLSVLEQVEDAYRLAALD